MVGSIKAGKERDCLSTSITIKAEDEDWRTRTCTGTWEETERKEESTPRVGIKAIGREIIPFGALSPIRIHEVH